MALLYTKLEASCCSDQKLTGPCLRWSRGKAGDPAHALPSGVSGSHQTLTLQTTVNYVLTPLLLSISVILVRYDGLDLPVRFDYNWFQRSIWQCANRLNSEVMSSRRNHKVSDNCVNRSRMLEQ
jgi:hypothetical protein